MFYSFFPKSRWFFLSALLWVVLAMGLWLGVIAPALEGRGFSTEQYLGLKRLVSPMMGVFCVYFLVMSLSFWVFWQYVKPQRYSLWSVLGTCLLLFSIYYTVECNVALNDWVGEFFDLIQKALGTPGSVSQNDLYLNMLPFLFLGVAYSIVYAFKKFFISHYIFRWRTAMNDYYRENWPIIRDVEGAAQRVQDDTMRFATMLETIGAGFVDALFTLLAFLPVLSGLSREVGHLPIVGDVPHGLVYVAIAWAVFGTVYTIFLGRKLPRLEYNNQRVEAAYRKELVQGEDDPDRAAPTTLKALFHDVRHNYFLIYRRYLFFNMGTGVYSQIDAVMSFFVVIPAVAVGRISFGVFTQVGNVFSQVSSSFQYVINSWSNVVALISIYKRLQELDQIIAQRTEPEAQALAQA